jgi:magnesium transporter
VETGAHAGFLFLSMLKKLYRSVEHEFEHVQSELHLIEEHIFSGSEVKMVEAISHASRDLLNLRQTIEPHRDMLEELDEAATGFFGAEFKPAVKRLSGEYYRVHNHIMRGIESARELRMTNDSLLSTKQNETMRVLTVMAVFTFPLSLLIAVFSLRAVDNPIADMPHGFLVALGATFLLWLAMFVFFKYRKWL